MPLGGAFSGQADWGAGIYRGREAPENAAYDLVNVLLDDEGQPFRRGGSAYKSTGNAGGTLLGLADVVLGGGQRTAYWTSALFGVLNGSDAPTSIASFVGSDIPRATTRPVVVADMMFSLTTAGSSDPRAVILYGGALSGTDDNGTATVTAGSRTVTGSGTTWAGTLQPGMILWFSSHRVGVVESVTSNTALVLSSPWAYETLTGVLGGIVKRLSFSSLLPYGGSQTFSTLGAAGRRLLITHGTHVHFSAADKPMLFDTNDSYEIPSGGYVLGIEGVGDTAIVFTTAGTWAIENLYFDPIDDAGNVQHVVRQLNDVILWGELGIARWRDVPVVPATDNVYLMPPGGDSVPIGDGIRPLYLGYVKAGYQPGTAAVHRGHYFLPILNGTTLVDVLVCRLDRGFAWSRWSGHGAGVAYGQRIGASTRSPKLFSVAAQRVTELTDAWSPSSANASEADESTHSIDIITRDLSTPGRSKGSTTRKVRMRYEATAAAGPTFTVSYARGPESAAWTSLGTALRGGAVSDGLDESVYAVAKQAPAIRFRIQSSSALSTFMLRSVEAQYTPSG